MSADVKRVGDEWHVFAKGGRIDTGMEAISWIARCVSLGAGEVVVNSMDTDGVCGGFNIPLIRAVCDAVTVPVIASGGASSADDFIKLFTEVPECSAGLAASIFHYGNVTIEDLKKTLASAGIPVRL